MNAFDDFVDNLWSEGKKNLDHTDEPHEGTCTKYGKENALLCGCGKCLECHTGINEDKKGGPF